MTAEIGRCGDTMCIIDTHGSCSSRLLILCMMLSGMAVSVVSVLVSGGGRCSLRVLILAVVHLMLRRLHLRRLHLGLGLRILRCILVGRSLGVLRLCRRGRLSSSLLGNNLRGVRGLRISLSHVMSGWTTRRRSSCKRNMTGDAGRSLAVSGISGRMRASHVRLVVVRGGRVSATVRIAVVVLTLLTSTHADLTSDTNTASLVGYGTAELGARSQSRELLGTEDGEWLGLDFQTVGNLGFSLGGSSGCCFICLVRILGILELFVQAETKSVFAFMADRKIREDEVSGLRGAVQVYHTGNRSTGQDGQAGGVIVGNTSLGNRTCLFQSRKQEVVRVHAKSDIVGVLLFTVIDAKLDNWRGVNRATVGGC